MREIKFRIWFKKLKQFSYFELYDLIDNCDGYAGNRKKDFILQQSSGRKDKNGKEIYEGDIITYREKMHEHGDIHSLKARVVYDDKYAAFGLTSISQDGELSMWNYFTDMTISDFEVVGNIFEQK